MYLLISLTFDQECSSPYLDRIQFHLTGSTMIWCDARKKDDCRISLPGFGLYLPCVLYCTIDCYLKRLNPFVELWCCKIKECIEFYLNSFSDHFYYTILGREWEGWVAKDMARQRSEGHLYKCPLCPLTKIYRAAGQRIKGKAAENTKVLAHLPCNDRIVSSSSSCWIRIVS